MAKFGVSIEKTISFRGAAQVFANVYHYDSGVGAPSDANLETLLDNMVAQEKTMHSSAVSFVRGRVWSSGGSPSANQMRVDKNLSGAGTLSTLSGRDPERATLIRWRAGSDSRGRPVYLRKWYHDHSGNFGGTSCLTSSQLGQTTEVSQACRDAQETAADFFRTITAGSIVFTMEAETGRQISGSTESHRWLEHHQLGDMWRSV